MASCLHIMAKNSDLVRKRRIYSETYQEKTGFDTSNIEKTDSLGVEFDVINCRVLKHSSGQADSS